VERITSFHQKGGGLKSTSSVEPPFLKGELSIEVPRMTMTVLGAGDFRSLVRFSGRRKAKVHKDSLLRY
jgi:hypothetical protein